ncbi:MAG: TIGR01777 family oxidoreductase [Bacteriovoracaceae bacterium]
MRILVTGATGLVGQKLCEDLLLQGHDVSALTRNKKKAQTQVNLPITWHEWNSPNEEIPSEALTGLDGIINLMGENIGEGRWTQKKKKAIYDSRVTATNTLAQSLLKNSIVLKFYVGASAIGYYQQNKNDEWLNELSPKGSDYLSSICQEWELSHGKIPAIRKSIARIGVVLANSGGMLQKLIPIYRLGAGGKIGSGEQWMSWIHIQDLTRILIFAATDEKAKGTFNAVAPEAVKNSIFNKILAMATDRPTIFPVPAFMLKLILGEASILALGSQRVQNSHLDRLKFEYLYPTLKKALFDICANKAIGIQKNNVFHYVYRKVHFIPIDVKSIFPFFSDATNLETITPDFLKFKITYQSTDKIMEGTVFRYSLKVNQIPLNWQSKITEWKENEGFVDYQESGPYQTWHHEHKFISTEKGTYMVDNVHYRLPFGPIGDTAYLLKVKNDIQNIFSYRSKVIEKLLVKNS